MLKKPLSHTAALTVSIAISTFVAMPSIAQVAPTSTPVVVSGVKNVKIRKAPENIPGGAPPSSAIEGLDSLKDAAGSKRRRGRGNGGVGSAGGR